MPLGDMMRGDVTVYIQQRIGKVTFSFRYQRGNQISMLVSSVEAHAALTAALRQNENPFHTFTAELDKFKKEVIRGLPKLDTNDILEDLAAQGFPALNAPCTWPTSARIPIWAT